MTLNHLSRVFMVSARGNVPPFLVMEVLAEANRFAQTSDKRVIHMSLGQPGKEVPQAVRDAVARQLQAGALGYTEGSGMVALRARIAQHYKEEYGIEVDAERIFITLGSSSAFFMALLCAFEKDDEVAITLPCYAAYPHIMQSVNVQAVMLRGTQETNFQPTIAMLEALPRKPHGIIIASPSNPTGTMMHNAELKAMAEYCDKNGIQMIADEIYHGIMYGKKATTMLAYSERAIVINSFSKYYLMPGWRVGWAVVPADMTRAYASLASNLFVSPSSIGQYAALEIFKHKDVLDATVAEYAQNREILLRELPAMGIDRIAPVQGAFYAYANVSNLTNDSVTFCREMLYATGVVAVSGVDFDREDGHHYVRFSFAGTTQDMAEAMVRLKGWIGK